jgi:surface antigen
VQFRTLAARFALVAAFCLITAMPAEAKSRYLQCVPFAREVSGIEIRGNAWTWWGQAAGKYERGDEPEVGSVMSFQRTRKMPLGHVAMVSEIVSDREIDVSEAGDWSQVKVWYGPSGGLGTSVYPVNGFIYAEQETPAAAWTRNLTASGEGTKLNPALDLDLSDLVPEKNFD